MEPHQRLAEGRNSLHCLIWIKLEPRFKELERDACETFRKDDHLQYKLTNLHFNLHELFLFVIVFLEGLGLSAFLFFHFFLKYDYFKLR